MWQPFHPALSRWRKEVLGIPPVPLKGPVADLYKKRQPWLYGFSPSVLPRPSDWPGWIHVVGYWFLDIHESWIPPGRVVDFLAAGPPPVCIGFGSMIDRERAKLLKVAIQALQQRRQCGISLTGWGGMQDIELPKEILAVESIPHEWLFPQMAAIVYHGGAGTTTAALRSGVPSIVTPFFADQPFWGMVVERLRVGPAPILRKKLSVSGLAEALKTATSDEGMKERASVIGEKIRKEDGIGRAVEVVGGLIN